MSSPEEYQGKYGCFVGDSEGIEYVYFNEESAMKDAIKKMNHKLLGGRLMVMANEPLGSRDYQGPCGGGVCRVHSYGVGGGGCGEHCYKCGLLVHPSRQCKIVGEGENGERGVCANCGEFGHLAKDCRMR